MQRFQYVRVIRGQLQISGWNLSTYPSLPRVIDYFRNVEYIGSLNLTLDTVNTAGDALVISTNPGLERVDLSRLRAVRYGNVRVRNNPALCYLGDFLTTNGSDSTYLTETQLILPTGSTNFKPVEACGTFHPGQCMVTECEAESMQCLLRCVTLPKAPSHTESSYSNSGLLHAYVMYMLDESNSHSLSHSRCCWYDMQWGV